MSTTDECIHGIYPVTSCLICNRFQVTIVKEKPVDESPIVKYFAYDHLPEKLQHVSEQFHYLAHWVDDTLPNGAEKSTALRKLLEAKDAAVRAALD